MIINLSYNIRDVKAFLLESNISHDGHSLLDISGICAELEEVEVIPANRYDKDYSIKQRAFEKSTSFSAEASHSLWGKKSIRSLQLEGLSIYWLSELSVKHAYYHWGAVFFYMRQLILEKPEIFAEEREIYLILTKRHYACLDWIRQLFRNKLGKKVKIYPSRPDPLRSIRLSWVYLSFLMKFIRLALSSKLKNAEAQASQVPSEEQRNYFVSHDKNFILGKKPHDHDHAYSSQKSRELGIRTFFIPFSWSFQGFEQINWAATDSLFLRSFPSVIELLDLTRQVFFCHLKVLFQKDSLFAFDGELIPQNVLKRELLLTLQKSWLFFYLLWAKKFFKQLKGEAQVFYADEFYETGRVISYALQQCPNPNIKSYGTQHGNFNESHSVYWIQDREIQTEEVHGYPGLPIPETFLVWGKFFKSFFLSKNDLPDRYVQVVGNLAYQKMAPSNPEANNKGQIDILWCTTLMIYARHEYQVFQKALHSLSRDYRLCIRLHPTGHISQEEMLDLLDPGIRENSFFDEIPELRDSLADRDLVISSGISTSYLDSIMGGRITCSILHEMAWDTMSELQSIPFLHVVKYAEEFDAVLEALENEPDPEAEELELISYQKTDRWESILAGKSLTEKLR